MKYKLIRPITFEEEEIKEIELDLEGLTGEDLAQAEREHLAMGGQMTSLTLSIAYCQSLAARASGLPVDAIRAMFAKDSSAVAMEVQVFLHDLESQLPGRSGEAA